MNVITENVDMITRWRARARSRRSLVWYSDGGGGNYTSRTHTSNYRKHQLNKIEYTIKVYSSKLRSGIVVVRYAKGSGSYPDPVYTFLIIFLAQQQCWLAAVNWYRRARNGGVYCIRM